MVLLHRTLRSRTLALGVLLAGIASAGAQQPAVATRPSPAAAQQAPANDQQAAITRKAQAFVEAYQKGDANALADFWTPEGDYTDVTGRVLKGRQAIAQDFAQFFAANKGAALRIDVQSLRFPTPDVAIEDGTTSILPPDGGIPDRTRYTNVLVRKNGDWLIESVRESAYVPPSNAGHLQPIAWLIGEWVQETKDPHAGRIAFEWTPDRNYMVGTRTVAVKDLLLDSGTQRIGWDPAAQLIRSWNFENDGGFSEGAWKPDGEKWIITTNAVQASGAMATAITTITRADPNTITLQTKLHTSGTEQPRDLPVITMKRVQEPNGAGPAEPQASIPTPARAARP